MTTTTTNTNVQNILNTLEGYLNAIATTWQTGTAVDPTFAWVLLVPKSIQGVATVMITCADYWIQQIDTIEASGVDKKTAVLTILGNLYDQIIPGILPLFLRPFNSQIKSFLINVVFTVLIDFIVSKYHGTGWTCDSNTSSSTAPPTGTSTTTPPASAPTTSN